MLRRAFLSGSLAGLLAACAEPAPSVPPEQVVERIYDPYFGRGEGQRLENAAPWTDELRDLIRRAERRAMATNQRWIDINPFFGDVAEVQLGALAVAAEAPPADGRVTVVVRYTNSGRTVEVRFDLVAIKGEWRVANVRGESWDLRSIAAAGAGPNDA